MPHVTPTPHQPRWVQTLAGQQWPLRYIDSCRRSLGSSFALHPLDMPPTVFLGRARDIHAMALADSSVLLPGKGARVIAPIVGTSSFMLCDGAKHRELRTVLAPYFRRSAIARQLVDIGAEGAAIAQWPTERPVPLVPLISALTLRIILRVVFGEDAACVETVAPALRGTLDLATTLMLQEPRLRHLPPWRRLHKRFLASRATLDAALCSVIERGRHGAARRHDVLGSLLATPLSTKQVRDQAMSLIVAGHETVTAQLAWTLQLLAHNPIHQYHLLEDLSAGSRTYLSAVISESMRHRPAFVFLVPRVVSRPISIGAFSYDAPTQLLGCTYLAHHDHDYFHDPYTFAPQRFLDTRPPFSAWMPWGVGRRHCLGKSLALAEMESLLEAVVAEFSVMPAQRTIEPPRWRSAIVVPRYGCYAILRKRR